MISLVVFDLDGTLVDSQQDLAESANATLAACGAATIPEAEIARMVGEGAAVLIARAFATAGTQPPADALEKFLATYHNRLLRHTKPYPGIPEVLAKLAKRVTLGVLTNKPLDPTRRILAGLNLAQYFNPSLVVGGDGVFGRKPDPAGLQHLMTLARASGATTMLVGDSVIDWRTARAAFTNLCLARYGFGWESFLNDQLMPGQCVVDNPGEILERV